VAYLGLLLALFLDTTVRLLAPQSTGWLASAPSVAFLTAVYIGLCARSLTPLYLAVVLGAMQDCFSMAWPMGHFAFLYGCGAYVAWRLARYLPKDNGVAQSAAVFLCGLVIALLSLLIVVASGRGGGGGGFGLDLLRALTGACVAPAYFSLLSASRFFQRALKKRDYIFAP
jgi:cell shape-determining protein MreD